MIKKLKIQKVEFEATKSKGTRNRILGWENFWHEYFWLTSEWKVGITLLKLSHARICSHPKSYSLLPYLYPNLLSQILFLAPLPLSQLTFWILIILVCLLFIHASIHNNLSAGAQNITGTYACLQALVNNALTWQSSCVIANNTCNESYLYNLEVYDVIK